MDDADLLRNRATRLFALAARSDCAERALSNRGTHTQRPRPCHRRRADDLVVAAHPCT